MQALLKYVSVWKLLIVMGLAVFTYIVKQQSNDEIANARAEKIEKACQKKFANAGPTSIADCRTRLFERFETIRQQQKLDSAIRKFQ